MTFTEAAVEVLRLAGKPLHYKKITELAIEKNLLSHVGKTPETTMSARLTTMVRKDRGDAPILKVKPGVFALREFADSHEVADGSDEHVDDDTIELTETVDDVEETETVTKVAAAAAPPAKETNERSLPGTDIFPEEDDDDELIFSNMDDDESPRRNKRRRGGRRRRERENGEREDAPRNEGARNDGPRNESRAETRNDSPRNDAHRNHQQRPRRSQNDAPVQVQGDWNKKPAKDESLGDALVDAIEQVLEQRGRSTRTYEQIAVSLVDAGRLSGEPSTLAPTGGRRDSRIGHARAQSQDKMQRFREVRGGVRLRAWDQPREAFRAQKEAERAAERQRKETALTFLSIINQMPAAAFVELLATWLNACEVRSIRGVAADVGDFNLAGNLNRGPESIPLAIAVFGAQRAVNRDHILELRGGLHHFGNAVQGWILAFGNVRDDARTEAKSRGALPISIFDAEVIVKSMRESGIGIKESHIPLSVIDLELLETLSPNAGDLIVENEPSKSGGANEPESRSAQNRRRRSRRRSRGGRNNNRVDGADGDATDDNAQIAETQEANDDNEPESFDAENDRESNFDSDRESKYESIEESDNADESHSFADDETDA
ncbi:MAG: winged helix-turn-helix domain-containing protein [Polyangiales bacterium]